MDHYLPLLLQNLNHSKYIIRVIHIITNLVLYKKINYFYDIKDHNDFRENPDYKGVCDISLSQEGHCRLSEVLIAML